jgi:hypothetical protein
LKFRWYGDANLRSNGSFRHWNHPAVHPLTYNV